MAHKQHDRAGKRLLALWLLQRGRVQKGKPIFAQERQVDLLYRDGKAPRPAPHIGLLERMACGVALFELFRNAMTCDELASAMVKRAEVRQELLRKARREGKRPGQVEEPVLWALSPTVSRKKREGFAMAAMAGWPRGFHAMPAMLCTRVVVLHDLPANAETLFLRLLARGAVQRRALGELDALPRALPLRDATMRLVVSWKAEASERASQSEEARELVMNVERIVQKWERDAIAKGVAKGRKLGQKEGEARGKAEALLVLLEARGLAVSEAQRRRVLACTAPATLDAWVRAAASASSTTAVLSTRPAQ